MCGAATWQEEGWTPFADLAADLAAAAGLAAQRAGADADVPIAREAAEVSVFPGVPFS
jgi:hypothetical protein